MCRPAGPLKEANTLKSRWRARLWVLSLGVPLCLPAPAWAASPSFPDVPPNYWAAPAIAQLAGKGILTGMPNGLFEPNAPLTRAQYVALLVRAQGLALVSPQTPTFTDVPPSNWAYPYVETAVQAGLIQGMGNGQFAPDAPLTREEMAVLMVRALHLNQVAQDLAGRPLPYLDQEEVASWAQGAVLVSAQTGLMTGVTPQDFQPLAPITRAQAAVVTERFLALPPGATASEALLVADHIVLTSSATSLQVGHSVDIQALVEDASGQTLPVSASFTTNLGSVSSAGTYIANAPGTALITAYLDPPSGVTLSSSLQLAVVPVAESLSFGTLPAAVSVGSSVTIPAEVLSSGAIAQGSSGLPLTLSLYGTDGSLLQQMQASDQQGLTSFSVMPPAAGTYALVLSSPGLSSVTAQILAQASLSSASLQLSLSQTMVPEGQTVSLTGSLSFAGGTPASLTAPVNLSLSPQSAGTLSATSATVGSSPTPLATFTAGSSPGPVTITASSPTDSGLQASVTLQVQSLGTVALGGLTNTTPQAGQTVQVDVAVLDPTGLPISSSVPVALNVTHPSGRIVTLSGVANGGNAYFNVSETRSGTYTLMPSAQGYDGPSSPTSLSFVPGPMVGLAVTSAPSELVVPGQSTQIKVAAVDAYGNPTSPPSPLPLTIIPPASPTSGTFTPAPGNSTLTSSPQVIGTFVSSNQAGSTQISVATVGYPQVTLSLQTLSSPAQVVAGKGLWVMYLSNQNWNINTSQLIQTAQTDGVTHIYLEVAASGVGFYGNTQASQAMDSLLAQAHAAHIAVIAWIYPTLAHPNQDAQLAAQVYNYTSPSGDKFDGIASDIEDQNYISTQTVGTYSAALRQAVGTNYPLIAVTYPPVKMDPSTGQLQPDFQSYPFSTLAQYMNVIAPMDYWHSYPTAGYTYQDVYNYVSQSISDIRSLTGNPNIAISVIGQAYDMFSSSGQGLYNPSPQEINGALQAAQDQGAIGFSLYRWGTATSQELGALGAFTW